MHGARLPLKGVDIWDWIVTILLCSTQKPARASFWVVYADLYVLGNFFLIVTNCCTEFPPVPSTSASQFGSRSGLPLGIHSSMTSGWEVSVPWWSGGDRSAGTCRSRRGPGVRTFGGCSNRQYHLLSSGVPHIDNSLTLDHAATASAITKFFVVVEKCFSLADHFCTYFNIYLTHSMLININLWKNYNSSGADESIKSDRESPLREEWKIGQYIVENQNWLHG